MNKFGILSIFFALFLVAAVSATTTTLSDGELTMEFVDVETVEFCISDAGGPMDVDVVISPVCKDLNGIFGCQLGLDDFAQTVFTAVPVEPTTGEDGCVDVTLTTNIIDGGDSGKFYYTVNGMIGDATVGSETGGVTTDVPELGVVAAGLTLLGAGLFIWKKRQ